MYDYLFIDVVVLFVYIFRKQVKIWFQNRRMKWKRSKKAQQEAKEKKSSSSSSSSTVSSVSSPSSATSQTLNTSTDAITNGPMQSINGTISEHIAGHKATADKMLDANLLLSSANGFHQSKTISNLDQHHRHIVNLSSNLTEYNSGLSIEDSMQAAAKLNRRSMIFADGNQDMFRPYVV